MGSRYNQRVILRYLDKYIKLGRNETLTVEQMCSNLRVKDVPWLRTVATSLSSRKLVQTGDSVGNKRKANDLRDCSVLHVQRLLLHSFVYWLVSDFIHPLICTHFYVTEGEGCGNQVLWYQRCVWTSVVRAGLKQIEPHFMSVLPRNNAVANSRSTDVRQSHANVRFLPKRTSVRAITNLRNRPNFAEKGVEVQSVGNAALYNCFHVLKKLYFAQPELAGFGTFGIDDIYDRFTLFRKTIRANCADVDKNATSTSHLPQFYVGVLDLEKCYDNVNTSQLFNVIRNLIEKSPLQSMTNNEGCILQRYSVSHRIASMERGVSKSIRHICTAGDMFKFEEAARELSQSYRKSIISDNVVHGRITKEEMLRVLRAHLFSHVVNMPSLPSSGPSNGVYSAPNQFTQIQGIPQGSVLSPILCNLYYGNAEREIFGASEEVERLGIGVKTFIIRMMDDYIIISTDENACKYFLQRAHLALRPYGGGVNPLKTRVNFDVNIELDGRRIPLQRISTRDMPWCGLLVDTHTLEIKPCMRRMLERPLRASVSVEAMQSGLALRRAMKSFVKTKCQAIVLDASLNSYSTVYQSIYTLFLVAAMRTQIYVQHMQGFRISKNVSFLIECIVEAVFFGARLIHSRTSKRLIRAFGKGVLAAFGADISGNQHGTEGRTC